jgi:hypothetical protein
MTWTQKLLAAAIFPAMLVALGACTTKFKSNEDGDVDADVEAADGAEDGVDVPDVVPDDDAQEIEALYTVAPGTVQTYNYPEPIPLDLAEEDRVALRVIHEDGRLVVFVVYDTDPSGSMEANIGVMLLETGEGGNLPVEISMANQIQTTSDEIEFVPDSLSIESSENYYYFFQSVRDHGDSYNGAGNVRVERISKEDLSGGPATPVLLFERNAANPEMIGLVSIKDGSQYFLAMTHEDPAGGNTSYGVTLDEAYLADLFEGSPPVPPAWADTAAVVGLSASMEMSMVATLARYQGRTAVGHMIIDVEDRSIRSSVAMFDGEFHSGQSASATIDLCATEACAGMPNIVAMPMLLGIDFPTRILFAGWMTSDSELNMESPGHAMPPPYMLHGGTYGGGSTVTSGLQTPPIDDNILPYDLRHMVSASDFKILLRRPEEIVYVWPSYLYEPHTVRVNLYLVSLGFAPLSDPAHAVVDTGMTQDLCRFYGYGAAADEQGVVYLVWNDWRWNGIPTDGLLDITGLKVMPVQFLPIM